MNLLLSILPLLSLLNAVNGLLWILWSHPNGNKIAGFNGEGEVGKIPKTQLAGNDVQTDELDELLELGEEEERDVHDFRPRGGRGWTRRRTTRRTRPTRPYTTRPPGGFPTKRRTHRRPPPTKPTMYPTPIPTLPSEINPSNPVQMPSKFQRMLNKTAGSISRVFQGENGMQIQETLTQVVTHSGLQILRTYFNFGHGGYLGGGMVGQGYYDSSMSSGGWSQGGMMGGSDYDYQGTGGMGGSMGGYGASGMGKGVASGLGTAGSEIGNQGNTNYPDYE